MINDTIKTIMDWVDTKKTPDESFFRPLSKQDSSKMVIKSPKGINNLFLYNLNTDEFLDFKLIPNSLSTTYTSRIVKAAPIAVLHPINFYVGGSAKSLSFSFDIHEDINGIQASNGESSIYETLKVINKMSEPSVSGGNVIGPSIYLQLGNQFAGKGHMTVSMSVKTPYRNGRYLLASISVNFTFHEEFEQSQQKLLKDRFNVSSLDIGYDPKKLFGDFYTDWIEESQWDYDFNLKNSFGDQKLMRLVRTQGSDLLEAYGNTIFTDPTSADMEAYGKAITPDPVLVGVQNHLPQATRDALLSNTLTSAQLEDYFDRYKDSKNYVFALDERGRLASIYYIELIAILNPMYSVKAKLNNLDILKTKVNTLLTSTKEQASGITEKLQVQYDDIVYILEKLTSIIDTQIQGLTILQGATP